MIATEDFFGAKLHINSVLCETLTYQPVVLDVETDEKDNFVGVAVTGDGQNVYYFSTFNKQLKFLLENAQIVGHSLKGDLKWLVGWGVDLKPEQLYFDTILASYVQNTTKESHSLKTIAKEILGMEWPTYKEMVRPAGPRTKKVTLDKQPIEKVARYCATDCLATYRLWKHFEKTMTAQQKKILEEIELPTARILMEMELKGVRIDVPYLEELKEQFDDKLYVLSESINEYWKYEEELNINSNRQIAQLLEDNGAFLPSTEKGNKKVDKATLERWKHLPVVPLLLEYSKIEKLQSTYVVGLLERQKNGRIYCSFNQITKDEKGNSVGISTSRLSSSNPNLQNIPAKTAEGQMIEKAFLPEEGELLAYFDFSQIEPRVLGHITKDPFLMNVFHQDRDLYSELLGPQRRGDSKTGWLAVTYGAQAKKLAYIFKKSETEAQRIINEIMAKIPGFVAWKERLLVEAKAKGGVTTLEGRFIPLPGLKSEDRWERLHWERVAVNSVFQGSAAEIMKKSLIALKKAGYVPLLTVHDSFLVGLPTKHATSLNAIYMPQEIQTILESVVKLSVPLKVSYGVGKNWSEAKQ